MTKKKNTGLAGSPRKSGRLAARYSKPVDEEPKPAKRTTKRRAKPKAKPKPEPEPPATDPVKNITVSLPGSVIERLRDASHATGDPASWIVRAGLEAELAKIAEELGGSIRKRPRGRSLRAGRRPG